MIGSSILVLKLTFSPYPFLRNLPLSNGPISQFLSGTCTEVSGVENIVQCGRLNQLSRLLGALKYSLLTYLLNYQRLTEN